MKNRCYSELYLLKTFEERFEYLKLDGRIGEDTFGFDRYLNQVLYKSPEWKKTRLDVILRDNGCDLGIEGYELNSWRDRNGKIHKPTIVVHHMIPITKEQILNRDPIIFNKEYLISASLPTHNAIHYGTDSIVEREPIVRKPNDTCPWR